MFFRFLLPFALMITSVGCGASHSYSAYSAETSNVGYASPVVQNMRGERQTRNLLEDDGTFYEEVSDDLLAQVATDTSSDASSENTVNNDPEPENHGLLLIYSGSVTLAVFHVEENQEAALVIVEEIGGYASERSSNSITFRVPAEHFRTTLDQLGELGDVLDMTWHAQDVSEQYYDIEIRLRNALQMRERLERLLTESTTIQEALAIESQLERITLTIEQMRGQLRFFSDRIAFSTLTLYFSPIYIETISDDEYRLPFVWLNSLGVEQLLSL